MVDEQTEPGAILKAARLDQRLAVMKALRERVSTDLDDPGLSGRDLAALSKRLMEIQDEIDAIKANAGGKGGGPSPDGGGGLADAAATPDAAFPSAS